MTRREIAWIVGMIVLAVASSYLLALAREPQSVWLWRDVFGVLR